MEPQRRRGRGWLCSPSGGAALLLFAVLLGPQWAQTTSPSLMKPREAVPLRAGAVLRLRGAGAEKGGLQGRVVLPYIPIWDGDPKTCQCLMNCRCAHCIEITGFSQVLDRSYPPRHPSICGMESDANVAIPSWPPTDILPQVNVPGDWPNVSFALFAPIGASEESLRTDMAANEKPVDLQEDRLAEANRKAAADAAAEGQTMEEKEADLYAPSSEGDLSSVDEGHASSSIDSDGPCEPWDRPFDVLLADSRRLVAEAGRHEWERNLNDGVIGHWQKIWNRTVHVEG
ncbi:hypothetical protein T484DRAFT_1885606, partial [Baffinella frigidus]